MNWRRWPEFVAGFVAGLPIAAQVNGVPVPIPASSLFTSPPIVSRSGDTVHLVLNGLVVPPVVGNYLRSADRGRTWSAPLNLGTPISAIASAGSRVYAFGQFLWRSADDGTTWQPGPNPTGYSTRAVHAAGLDCHVLGGQSVDPLTYSRTLDGGATWSAPRMFGPTAHDAHLVVDGTTTHVFWTWVGGGNNATYYQRSTDNGTTWLANPVQLAGAATLGTDQVGVSGSYLHLLRGSYPAEYWRSTDSGATWLPPVSAFDWPRLAVSGSNVYLMLAGAVIGLPGVVVMRSTNDGTTWTGSSISPLTPWQRSIAASGSVVCAAWSETSLTRTIATSDDAGATWHSSPVGSGSLNERGWPVLCVQPPAISVLWLRTDYLLSAYIWWPAALDVSGDNGSSWHLRQSLGWGPAWFLEGQDTTAILWGAPASSTYWLQGLFYGTVYGHERFGPSKPGTGGIAPSLRLTGTPQLGNNVTVTVASTVGGATTVLGASFAGEASTPLGSSLLLLAPPATGFWGVASGAPAQAGVGSMALPFVIPSAPSLHQQRVTFQGFALDANAAEGFSSTAGLTMIVL